MRDHEDTNYETMQPEGDELVRRLRELQWPSVRTEVRERCWNAFNQRLADRLVAVEERHVGRRNAASRLDYSRRALTAKVPPAQMGRTRSWTARPTRRIAAFAA